MNTSRPDDHIVRRAVDELRRLPEVDPAKIRAVVQAAAQARVTPADEPMPSRKSRVRSGRVWGLVGLAAAAGIVGFVARGFLATNRENAVAIVPTMTAMAESAVSESAPGALNVRQVASVSADPLPILEQFVFENTNARRVSVVGDFNNWNPKTAPMTRSREGGFWSVIVPIAPGRHMYGFMIDDSLFVLDPRALSARDPDLGTEGSIRMVGRGTGDR